MLFPCQLFSVSLCFTLSLVLFGCNTSDKYPICTINSEQTLSCNGGYSYWIGDVYATASEVLAITGVSRSKNRSNQWIAFVNNDLSEVIADHQFNNLYYADEHNAPAVIALPKNQWLVARTGHNDTFDNGQGIIEVTLFDQKFEPQPSHTLRTVSGSSYVQLVKANNKLYLLTRDTNEGWGVFISDDLATTWSDWQAIKLPPGRKYALIKKENRSGQNYERIILSTSNHPLDHDQQISYSYMDLAIDDPMRELTEDIRLGKAKESNSFNSLLQVSSETSSNIRLLDVYNDNNSSCHLYSSQNDLKYKEKWQLNIIARNVASESTVTYEVGNFSGVLGDNAYITGASIKSCHYVDGDSIDVLVTSELEESAKSTLSLISLDAQTGVVLSEHIIYSSDKKLYRPVYIEELNYVMFNEAEYWKDYENWSANQIIVKL